MAAQVCAADNIFVVFNVNIGTLWLSDRQSAKVLKPPLNDWQLEISLKR